MFLNAVNVHSKPVSLVVQKHERSNNHSARGANGIAIYGIIVSLNALNCGNSDVIRCIRVLATEMDFNREMR